MAQPDLPKGRCLDAPAVRWTPQKELDLSILVFKSFSFWGPFVSQMRDEGLTCLLIILIVTINNCQLTIIRTMIMATIH